MALVAKFGRPDFFIRMTASPAWKEVVENLRPERKLTIDLISLLESFVRSLRIYSVYLPWE